MRQKSVDVLPKIHILVFSTQKWVDKPQKRFYICMESVKIMGQTLTKFDTKGLIISIPYNP